MHQGVLKGEPALGDDIVRRVPAGEIEAVVLDKVRALLRQPEIVVATWQAARAEVSDITEAETLAALQELDPLWDQLFPAEQARIIRLLVEKVVVGPEGVDVALRIAGLTSLAHDLRASFPDAQEVAAA